MFNIVAVTNRMLCSHNLEEQIEKLAKAGLKTLILREKDLSEEEYQNLAVKVMAICEKYQVSCMLHSFVDVAIRLHADNIHLPISMLREMKSSEKEKFSVIGVSCHSVEEAVEAQRLGCSYVIAGHIFETDCKKGLEPRGLAFLEAVCKAVAIPVYAIGGITEQNIHLVKQTGAAGACVMSSLMKCENPKTYLETLERQSSI